MNNHDVTLDNYVQLACRTEAPIDGAVRARLNEPGVIARLTWTLELFAHVAQQLDAFKKYLFYGKALPANVVLAPDDTVNVRIVDNLQEEKLARLLHSVLGICTEAGELVEDDHKGKPVGILPVLKGLAPLDVVNFLEEFGDLDWYQAQGIDVLNGLFQFVLQTNIDKLRARYPEKFTETDAINRDTDVERLILETGAQFGDDESIFTDHVADPNDYLPKRPETK